VVIEICIPYPGGPTRIRVTDIPVYYTSPPFSFSSGPPGCFIHISIITPVVHRRRLRLEKLLYSYIDIELSSF
jgi:hypothetical protein